VGGGFLDQGGKGGIDGWTPGAKRAKTQCWSCCWGKEAICRVQEVEQKRGCSKKSRSALPWVGKWGTTTGGGLVRVG